MLSKVAAPIPEGPKKRKEEEEKAEERPGPGSKKGRTEEPTGRDRERERDEEQERERDVIYSSQPVLPSRGPTGGTKAQFEAAPEKKRQCSITHTHTHYFVSRHPTGSLTPNAQGGLLPRVRVSVISQSR